MFQNIYAVREQMDRTFSTHGSLSLVSGVMVCFGLSNFVSLQYTTGVIPAPTGGHCLLDSPGSCRSYRPLLCRC